MAPVEFIILLGLYSTDLVLCFFVCRLIYIIVITAWRRINAYHDSTDSSSSSADEGCYTEAGSQQEGDGNRDSNCYDEEQSVVGDDTGSGGADRCCICLEQMPDAAGAVRWRRLWLKQTTQEDGKTCRRLEGCGHVFHAGCIDEWLKRSRACPTCRPDARPGDAGRISSTGTSTVAYR